MKPKHPGGRPKIVIDWTSFDKLCAMQCTLEEISSYFDCSEDTIERAVKREKKTSFADYFRQKSKKGTISLRRRMYEIAQTGNVTMLIWLSKNWLGYADKIEEKVTSKEIQTVSIKWADEEDVSSTSKDEASDSSTSQDQSVQ